MFLVICMIIYVSLHSSTLNCALHFLNRAIFAQLRCYQFHSLEFRLYLICVTMRAYKGQRLIKLKFSLIVAACECA